MRDDIKNKIQANRLKNQEIMSLRKALESMKRELNDRDKLINDLRQELTVKEKVISSEEEIIVSKAHELQGVYNSTGYRYLLKPLWDFLWWFKKKFKSVSFNFASVIKNTFNRGIKINRLCYFALSSKSLALRRIYLSHLKHNTFPPMPTRLILRITRNCNLKKETTIRREDAFRIIDKAAHIGIKELVITGGEPFLHPHLFDIVDFANSKNLNVTLITDGFLVKHNIEKILKSGFFYIRVSIDGKEDARGILKNYKGAYRNAMEAIELIHQYGIPAAVNFIVTNKNIHELEDIYNYFATRNIKVNFCPVINKPEFFMIEPYKRQVYLNFIKKLFRKGELSNYEYDYLKKAVSYFSNQHTRVRCLGLNLELGIDTNGNISPCCISENRKEELNNLGNILTDDLEELWSSPRFHKARLSVFTKGCENCFNPSICELTKLTGIDYLVSKSKHNHASSI